MRGGRGVKVLANVIAIAFVLAFVGGCGCRKSPEEKAEDILIGKGGAKEHVSELARKGLPHLKKLLESKSSRTRMPAISALGELKGNKEATQILIEMTESETKTDVYFALIALAHQGVPEAKALIEKFFKHENPYFREAACWAIGEYGDKELYPLLDRATRDKDINVRKVPAGVKERYEIGR